MKKTRVFSHNSKPLKNGTEGPEGMTPESAREAFSKLITETRDKKNSDSDSTYS